MCDSPGVGDDFVFLGYGRLARDRLFQGCSGQRSASKVSVSHFQPAEAASEVTMPPRHAAALTLSGLQLSFFTPPNTFSFSVYETVA